MPDQDDKQTEDELTETAILESVPADFVSLLPVEEASTEEGFAPVRIIKPGWGSSGYYSADVLRKSAEEGTFDGAHMHWDHRTSEERPERSTQKWAGVIVEGSTRYEENGAEGAGVYGKAYVFPHWRNAVESMRSHIGLSIVGSGKTKYGKVGDRSGPIFESLNINDVDFVTRPGAGGKITKQFAGFAESKPAQAETEESETETMPETKTQETETPAVEALVQKAVAEQTKALQETFTKQLEEIQGASRLQRSMDEARFVVNQSNLPDPAKERVTTLLLADTRLAESESNAVKIAQEAIESERKYIEQFTPMHLRQPDINESFKEEDYEKSLDEAMNSFFGDLEDED